jgi:hypothetical protein
MTKAPETGPFSCSWGPNTRSSARPPQLKRSVGESLGRLTGDLCDEREILVLMEDDEPRAVGDRRDEQVWHRRCAVVAATGKDGEDFDGTVPV